MTNLEDLAAELINIVGGVCSEQNVKGVVKVLNGVKKGVNLHWEDYLNKSTDEVIATNKFKCLKCNTPIKVDRTGTNIHVYQEI